MGMIRMFTVTCDNCGEARECSEWYAQVARELAIAGGWKADRNTFLCPDCLEAGMTFAQLGRDRKEALKESAFRMVGIPARDEADTAPGLDELIGDVGQWSGREIR